MRTLLLLSLAFAGPAVAQTPLCAWSGTGLICPDQPSATISPLPDIGRSGILPSPEQRLDQLQAQADLDRAVIAAQAEQAQQRAALRDRANAVAAARICAGAETLVLENRPGDLAGFAPQCAIPK